MTIKLFREGPGKVVGLPSNCLSIHIFICCMFIHLTSFKRLSQLGMKR